MISQALIKRIMVSVLGLDIGSKRIGVAGCDQTGLIAVGLTTLHRTGLRSDLAQLRILAQQRSAESIVVGLPRNMNGTLGPQAERVQRLADQISAHTGLPIHYEDERLTTVQAQRFLIALNLSATKRRALVDQEAAVLILQQWLNRKSWLQQEHHHG